MAKLYVCLYCDDEKGAPDTAQHCDQRPQPGAYSHVWQVIRTSAPAWPGVDYDAALLPSNWPGRRGDR